jgi:hypothetical protein
MARTPAEVYLPLNAIPYLQYLYHGKAIFHGVTNWTHSAIRQISFYCRSSSVLTFTKIKVTKLFLETELYADTHE